VLCNVDTLQIKKNQRFVIFVRLDAIIFDTVCLSETAGRKTHKDETIISQLQILQPSLDRNKIFEELKKIKQDDISSRLISLCNFCCLFSLFFGMAVCHFMSIWKFQQLIYLHII